jgi:hypothetical protein
MATRVSALFIGNSFTARNDVPGLIASMAAGQGHRLNSKLLSIGGASLKQHFNKGLALASIRSREFDTVVLQEQSTLPVKGPARMAENVRLFDGPIREAGAKMVLYLTWARRHAPESQAAITGAYTSIGRELGATVVPAGVAWERVLTEHPGIVLHDKDGSHPNLAGSYLAACVFFAVLFAESPVGTVAPATLDAGDAAVLQRAAWAVAEAPLPGARAPAARKAGAGARAPRAKKKC